MPPPLEHPCLQLKVLNETFIVRKFAPDDGLPADVISAITKPAAKRQLFSLTHTREETSLVCAVDDVTMTDATNLPRWRCIKIKGPMEFELTGVMCDFTTPLKQVAVPIFAISTWNTDYILVPETKIEQAVAALKADAWKFE